MGVFVENAYIDKRDNRTNPNADSEWLEAHRLPDKQRTMLGVRSRKRNSIGFTIKFAIITAPPVQQRILDCGESPQ